MVFNSLQYAGFLTAVLAVYWSLPRRARPVLLLVASYLFYASWGWHLLGLLALSTMVAWAVGRSLPTAHDARRRLLVACALLASVGVLSLFKVIQALTGGASLGSKDWVIPVGLSFFTFQAISYVVDIYRRDLEPADTFVDVALYIAFFPHLLAGPVVRARKLIPAFHAVPQRPDRVKFTEGCELILFGLFKKVVLADPIAAQITTLAGTPRLIGTANGLIGCLTGIMAAYFDITAYIDIARGSAKLLGIDMQRNSLSPLLRSTGFADFWRRWQLTLMMWFRDYVYRPLRGDGRSAARETLALFGSFAVLGIWHGLSIGWVAWGTACGTIIVIERRIQSRGAARRRAALLAARREGRRPRKPKANPKWVRLAITYALVVITLPLISARRLGDITAVYRVFYAPNSTPLDWDLIWLAAMGLIALFALDGRERRREATAGTPDPLTYRRIAAFSLSVVAIIIFSGARTQPFIYFNF
ncbi:MAG: putative rane protein involved in D-alanine export [Acidimicrobiales bacterium]|nr:putative rane protein involved in D-alanine export [Acidimicrobiales bacterium]